MQQSCTHFGVVTGNPNMVMALAGNKTDLEDKRKVTTEVSTVFLLLLLLLLLYFNFCGDSLMCIVICLTKVHF